eukprot:185677-Rhodomonas_salina.3
MSAWGWVLASGYSFLDSLEAALTAFALHFHHHCSASIANDTMAQHRTQTTSFLSIKCNPHASVTAVTNHSFHTDSIQDGWKLVLDCAV